MRNVLITILIVVVLAVGVSVIGIGSVLGNVKHYAERITWCEQFVDEAVVAICTNWESQELVARVRPGDFQPSDTPELEKGFNFFRKLGPMVTYHGCEGEIEMIDGEVYFLFTAEADFQKGPGTVTIEGSETAGTLYIDDFRIRSGALLEHIYQ